MAAMNNMMLVMGACTRRGAYRREENRHRRAMKIAPDHRRQNQNNQNNLLRLFNTNCEALQLTRHHLFHLSLVGQLPLAILDRFALLSDTKTLLGVRMAAQIFKHKAVLVCFHTPSDCIMFSRAHLIDEECEIPARYIRRGWKQRGKWRGDESDKKENGVRSGRGER